MSPRCLDDSDGSTGPAGATWRPLRSPKNVKILFNKIRDGLNCTTSVGDFDPVKLAISGLHVDRDEGESHSIVRIGRDDPGAHQIVVVAGRESGAGDHGEIGVRHEEFAAAAGHRAVGEGRRGGGRDPGGVGRDGHPAELEIGSGVGESRAEMDVDDVGRRGHSVGLGVAAVGAQHRGVLVVSIVDLPDCEILVLNNFGKGPEEEYREGRDALEGRRKVFDGELAEEINLDESIRVDRDAPKEIVAVDVREREERRGDLSTRSAQLIAVNCKINVF